MATITTTIRLDSNVKKKSTQLLNGLGMSMSEAINIFLRQTILCNGLPFPVTYPQPTEQLLNAIQESEDLINDPKAKRYSSVKELFEDLDK